MGDYLQAPDESSSKHGGGKSPKWRIGLFSRTRSLNAPKRATDNFDDDGVTDDAAAQQQPPLRRSRSSGGPGSYASPTIEMPSMAGNPRPTSPDGAVAGESGNDNIDWRAVATNDVGEESDPPGVIRLVSSLNSDGTGSGAPSSSLGERQATTATLGLSARTGASSWRSDRRRRSSRRQHSGAGGGDAKEEKLGTYSGVFLPCLAQIVGVIFFLRLPTITGQAGTYNATAIVLCCVFSTLLTSLSLSAIASNGTILSGGPYYIISRTLGVEIGGALGLLFYLGTTLGASMHVMGAVETLVHRKKHAYQNNASGNLQLLLDSCPNQVYSLIIMFVIARIVSVGSKHVTNAANFFLATVGVSILSIIVGTTLFAFGIYEGSLSDEDRAFNDNLHPNYRADPKTGVTPTFWGLVAIFYPATTGILAGTNRSSKLKTPNRSIPIGTISAIGVTTVLYLSQVWMIGSVVSNDVLIYNKLVLTTVAFPSRILAKMGMVMSCIGAALQCMAGAPQLLGAIAADDVIPFLKFLTKKKRDRPKVKPSVEESVVTSDGFLVFSTSESNVGGSSTVDGANSLAESETSADIEDQNSKRAVWFSWGIASIGTLLGNIDHITPILTMFYLMMYGGINLCCFLLAWVDSPGFRPQFRFFSKKTALLGFVWCLVLSFLISWLMALLALLLLYAIFKYINISSQQQGPRNVPKAKVDSKTGTNWGDVYDSIRYKLTTAILAKVTGSENFHAKNWRPQLLTFIDTDEKGVPLSSEVLALASQFQGGRGLNIVVSIKQGSYLRKGTYEFAQHCNETLKESMGKERLQGFCKVLITQSRFNEAAWAAGTHAGLGPVSPNTILLSWMENWRRRLAPMSMDEMSDHTDDVYSCNVEEFVDTLKGFSNMRRAVCVLKGRKFPRYGDVMPPDSTIDIYWLVDDGGLCLLLSYIISRNPIWRRNASLRVYAVSTTSEDDDRENLKQLVVEFFQQIRINASVFVVSLHETDIADDFRARSCDVCPMGVPNMTIGEKFRSLKDDAMSTASSASGQSRQPAFLSLDINGACIPTPYSPPRLSKKFAQPRPVNENEVYVEKTRCFLLPDTAKKFNELIRENSVDASLVVTHLPLPHKASSANEFMAYVDSMFENVDNMLLMQGTGVEYMTTVA